MRTYAVQASNLRESLETLLNDRIGVVASNCHCFYRTRMETYLGIHYERMLATNVDHFVRLPHWRSSEDDSVIKKSLCHLYGSMIEPLRGFIYQKAISGYDIAHFHQSLYAFGYDNAAYFLKHAKKQKKVITIHSLSAEQRQDPKLNLIYNSADAVIVHNSFIKDVLLNSGVQKSRIHVIPYGVTIKPIKNEKRKGAIMFAGSPLIDVKGFQYIAAALRILKEENIILPLKLHGVYMPGHKEWAIDIAKKEGIEDLLEWLKLQSEDELIEAYQNSEICVIPYTNYLGSFSVSVAMANETPVVATDASSVSDYADGTASIVKSGSSEELASAIKNVISDKNQRSTMIKKGRLIAEKKLSWPTIAEQTLAVYQEIIGN